MKKYLSLCILVVFCNCLAAQNTGNSEQNRKELEQIFRKADAKNPQNILWYKIGDKTGLIDAKTKKVIIAPTKDITFGELIWGSSLFTHDFGLTYKNVDFRISIKENKFNVEEEQWGMMAGRENPNLSNNTIGFSVDANGYLISYNKSYESIDHFAYQKKQYAIVKIQDYYAVIDELGNSLPPFQFARRKITKAYLPFDKETQWFVVYDDNFKGTFVNFQGEEKLKNELLGDVSSAQNSVFGLNLNFSRYMSGILDLNTKEWVIKPQSQYKFIRLDWAYSGSYLDTKKIEDREKVNIYILVEEGNMQYFMDLNMNKYLPVGVLK